MSSPFPGMDPYLEDAGLWPAFHHELIACLHQMLLPALAQRYRAGIEQRRYAVEGSPDGQPQEHREEYLAIRDGSGGRLITLLDVVSPANKRTKTGRQTYLETHRKARDAGANLVEIDLIMQGRAKQNDAPEGPPKGDYTVAVMRASRPGRFEIYAAPLGKRLPRFRLPLAGDDRGPVVDLPGAFARAFEQGGFAARIDYRRDPPATLSAENQAWLNDLLVTRGLRGNGSPRQHDGVTREPVFSHDAIAAAARRLWEVNGRPHGRDEEFWFRAIEQLQSEAHGG
jgi:Protein of unknown function (DUF4058)/Protein of unknown function (DUF2934)